MNRRWLALGSVVALLLLFGLFLGLDRSGPAIPEPEAPEADRIVRRLPSAAGPVPVSPNSEPVPEPGGLPAPSPQTRFSERLAAVQGKLHVRCFVGEEYEPVKHVDNGWWSTNTTEWAGQDSIGDLKHNSLAVVRWSAPEGATTTTCSVEEPRWAYLTVSVTEESGGPAGGVGISGCGGIHETGDDGRVEYPVLVSDKPCTLDVFRWDPEAEIHSQAFIRVAALVENEARTVRARLNDFEPEPGEAMPRFDFEAVRQMEGGISGIPERLPAETVEDEIADYQERLASNERYLDDLEKVLEQTPEDDRGPVEAERKRSLEWGQDYADHLEELYERTGQ